MTTPRRYVRAKGGTYTPEAVCAACNWWTFTRSHAAAIWIATEHARTCPAVAAAMERDQLRAELDRMRADRDRLRDRLHQINPLT